MRFPLVLAHGQGLVSYVFIAYGAGAVGLSCLTSAGVLLITKPGASRRTVLKLFLVFVVCSVLVLFAPLLIGFLHLP
jgi:hypothetical protein